jgi:hypothetical protein
MAQSTINTQTTILDRALAGASSEMTPETARFLLSLQLDPSDDRRANELAQKARDGRLTPDEQTEIDEYRRIGRVIEMLKLKAMAVLKHAT